MRLLLPRSAWWMRLSWTSKEILPCAVRLEGEYGIDGVVVGVPVKLGAAGVEQVLQLELSGSEKQALVRSADAVRETVAIMGL